MSLSDVDTRYRAYNFGISEGKEIVKSYLEGEDILDLAFEPYSDREVKRMEREPEEVLELLVRDFIDGLEDGIKSQCGKEKSSYFKWMREHL